jgi:lysophospholipid acyltransferase (LPLAT)-like uncharacterized protein
MKELKYRIMAWLVPSIFWIYLWLTRLSSRIDVIGSEYPDSVRQTGDGFIYAFWHNRQIILPLVRSDEPIHCLISDSRDGEYVARIARWFGKKSIRGSTTRGGFEAMKSMMQLLRKGGIVAITPDGPVGPPFKVKQGVIQMAQSLGCPIIPIAFDASRKKIFASWDGFYLPYPFSRITVVFGEPFFVDKEESIEDACQRLEQALNGAVQAAAQALES